MKKSNAIIFVLLALVSVFLLWLWCYLGFSNTDEPLDFILSIVWWVVILGAIVIIMRVEKARREQIRTVYVSDDLIFNSETGSLPYDDPIHLVTMIEKILGNLKYNFTKNDLPNENAFPINLVVRTFEYKEDTWKGEVVSVDTNTPQSFDSKEKLFRILNSSPI